MPPNTQFFKSGVPIIKMALHTQTDCYWRGQRCSDERLMAGEQKLRSESLSARGAAGWTGFTAETRRG